MSEEDKPPFTWRDIDEEREWFRIWSPDSEYTGDTPSEGGKYYEAFMTQSEATDLTMMLRLITGDNWFNNAGEPDLEYRPRTGEDSMAGLDGIWDRADGSWQDRNS